MSRALFVIAVVPLIVFLIFLYSFTANIPIDDQFHVVRYLLMAESPSAVRNFIFQYYAGHWLIVPYTLQALGEMLHLFDFQRNTLMMGLLTYVYGIILLGIAFPMRQWRGLERYALIVLCIWLPWVFFQLSYYHLSEGIVPAHLFFFCALWLLRKPLETTYKHVILAIIFCVLSSYSYANGLAVWVALFPLLLASPKKGRIQKVIVWILAAILCVSLYWWHVGIPMLQMTPIFSTSLRYYVEFFLTVMGYPILGGSVAAARMAGCVFLLVSILVFVHAWKPRVLPWVSVFLYGLGGALLITLARAYKGPLWALSPEYITMIAPTYLGLCLLLITSVSSRWVVRAAAVAVPIMAFLIISYIPHWQEVKLRMLSVHSCFAASLEAQVCKHLPFYFHPEKMEIGRELQKREMVPQLHLRDDDFDQSIDLPRHMSTTIDENEFLPGAIGITSSVVFEECIPLEDVVLRHRKTGTLLAYTKAYAAGTDPARGPAQCRQHLVWDVFLDSAVLRRDELTKDIDIWIYHPPIQRFTYVDTVTIPL